MIKRSTIRRIRLDFLAGSDIVDCCIEAVKAAELLDREVELEFNGVSMTVTKDDTAAGLVNRYWIDHLTPKKDGRDD